MTEVHTQSSLALKIDATPAKKGAAEFTSEIDAVKRAVRDLERDTTGAFTSLNKVDVLRLSDAEAAIRRTGSAAGGLSTAIGSPALYVPRKPARPL